MKVNYKNIILYLIAFVAFSACSAGKHATAQSYDDEGYYQQNDNYDDYSYDHSDVDINSFSNALDPYGRWIVSPSYGRVWICNEPGFVPYYTRGHWMYTTYGWTWASDYSWGWAPFHYGRWAYEASYGWMWVPGSQWGPAWVGWRTGGDYYGWAPLAPGVNISVGFSFGNYMPADRWCFVPRRYVSSPYFANYRVDRGRNTTIINNTTIIKNVNVYKNTRYVVGPDRREVERFSGQRINTVKINNDSKPGNYRVVNKNTVTMYRPEIKKNITINNNQKDVRINNNQKDVRINNNQKDVKIINNQKDVKINNDKDVKINNHITNNDVNINHGKDADKQRKEIEANRKDDRNINQRIPGNRNYETTRDDKRNLTLPREDQINDDRNKNDNRINDNRHTEIQRNSPDNRDINDFSKHPRTTRDNAPAINRDNNRQQPQQDWNRINGRNADINRANTMPQTRSAGRNDRVQNHRQPQYKQSVQSPPLQQQTVKRKKD